MSSFALPEGLKTVDMKFTQRLGVYRNMYFNYFSGPGTSNCSGWHSPGVSVQGNHS